ncbi:hypothetical protein [Acaryochloris thomasi]|uniref:hypothetical protein n=1 Tax=Acaryochloris thomasi TaxID=2929456 RepID=UPI001313F3A4|nr:hypothetical protein [Acaryochloris thomasi]
MILSLTCGLGMPAALANSADYYVGAGARAGFNDDTAAVINAKLKIADFGRDQPFE